MKLLWVIAISDGSDKVHVLLHAQVGVKFYILWCKTECVVNYALFEGKNIQIEWVNEVNYAYYKLNSDKLELLIELLHFLCCKGFVGFRMPDF